MDIYKFADLIDQDLIIRRYSNKNDLFTCSFERAEIKESKEDRVLSSDFGYGRSPLAAIKKCVHRIKGRVLVIDAMSDSRKEFQVPKDLRVVLK